MKPDNLKDLYIKLFIGTAKLIKKTTNLNIKYNV